MTTATVGKWPNRKSYAESFTYECVYNDGNVAIGISVVEGHEHMMHAVREERTTLEQFKKDYAVDEAAAEKFDGEKYSQIAKSLASIGVVDEATMKKNEALKISWFANRIRSTHPLTAQAIDTLLEKIPELSGAFMVAPSLVEGFEWSAVFDSKAIPLWLMEEHGNSDDTLFNTASMFACALVEAKNNRLSERRKDVAVHKMVTDDWHIAAPANYDGFERHGMDAHTARLIAGAKVCHNDGENVTYDNGAGFFRVPESGRPAYGPKVVSAAKFRKMFPVVPGRDVETLKSAILSALANGKEVDEHDLFRAINGKELSEFDSYLKAIRSLRRARKIVVPYQMRNQFTYALA